MVVCLDSQYRSYLVLIYFIGLTYDDTAQSILNCYKVEKTPYMLYRLEMCSMTAWKHSQEISLIRRWMIDMKTPKRRAHLFPPWKLKQSLMMRYVSAFVDKMQVLLCPIFENIRISSWIRECLPTFHIGYNSSTVGNVHDSEDPQFTFCS